jgi:hypothetical protein
MNRKLNKILAILAVCFAATCPATTCSFDATLPPMAVSYGYLYGIPPIWIVDVQPAEGLPDADPADPAEEDPDG